MTWKLGLLLALVPFAEQALSVVVLALLDSLLLWWSWSRLL